MDSRKKVLFQMLFVSLLCWVFTGTATAQLRNERASSVETRTEPSIPISGNSFDKYENLQIVASIDNLGNNSVRDRRIYTGARQNFASLRDRRRGASRNARLWWDRKRPNRTVNLGNASPLDSTRRWRRKKSEGRQALTPFCRYLSIAFQNRSRSDLQQLERSYAGS